MSYHIYQVIDPRDNKIIFIGYTQNMESRKRSIEREAKVKPAKSRRATLRAYVYCLIARGHHPKFTIIDSEPTTEAAEYRVEQEVKRMTAQGIPLLNNTKNNRIVIEDSFGKGGLIAYFRGRLTTEHPQNIKPIQQKKGSAINDPLGYLGTDDYDEDINDYSFYQ